MAYYHRVSVGSFLLKIGMLAGICFSLYIFMQFYINISSFYRKNWFLRVPKLQFDNWWHWFWFGDFAILLSFPRVFNVLVSADFQKWREISTVLIWKSIWINRKHYIYYTLILYGLARPLKIKTISTKSSLCEKR